MTYKRYYLTKRENNNLWNYITDPVNPFSVQQMGIIEVDNSEIRVDNFGMYIERPLEIIPNNSFSPEPSIYK